MSDFTMTTTHYAVPPASVETLTFWIEECCSPPKPEEWQFWAGRQAARVEILAAWAISLMRDEGPEKEPRDADA